jgi:hypothetical protein
MITAPLDGGVIIEVPFGRWTTIGPSFEGGVRIIVSFDFAG